MPLAARILLCAVGILLFMLAAFVYEDDEKRIQSRLVDWWVRLDDKWIKKEEQDKRAAGNLLWSATRILDRLFGKQLLSGRVVNASIYVSSFGYLLIVGFFPQRFSGVAFYISLLAYVLLLWGSIKVFTPRHRFLAFLKYAVYSMFPFCLLVGTVKGDPRWRTNPFPVISEFSVGFALSLSTNALIMVFYRWLLRRFSLFPVWVQTEAAKSVRREIGVKWVEGIVFGLVAGGALAAPLLIWKWIQAHSKLLEHESFGSFLFGFNIGGFLVVAIVLAVSTMLLANQIAWNALLRPLYALQRLEVFSHKKELCGLAIALLYSGLPLDKSWIAAVLEAVKKLFGG